MNSFLYSLIIIWMSCALHPSGGSGIDHVHEDSFRNIIENGLIIQPVIPKTGSTTLRHIMAPIWKYIFSHPEWFTSQPYLAGSCFAPKLMANCMINQNFPCIVPIDETRPLDRIDSNQGRYELRCSLGFPINHLALSEIKNGFLYERGLNMSFLNQRIPNKVFYVTVLRHPIKRVASEFYHWKKKWCCDWFFSDDLQQSRLNISLMDFVQHVDCPANNRQTWMLAELPLLPIINKRNNMMKIVGASQFFSYFPAYYNHNKSYTRRLNEDMSLLASSSRFIEQAHAVGITEQMDSTLSLIYASLFLNMHSKQNFHSMFRITNKNCYEMYYQTSDDTSQEQNAYHLASQLDAIRQARLKVGTARHLSYTISIEERDAIERHNQLDIALFKVAKRVNSEQLLKYNLCQE